MALVVAGALVLALSLVGALNALYFLLVTYGHVRSDPRWLPRVCRMDKRTCWRIVHTRYAHTFGLSNAAYGLVWYALAAGAGVMLVTDVEPPFCEVLLAIAGLTVIFGLYLVWALRVRLRTHCPLCYLGHAINAGLFGVFGSVCLIL